MNAATQAYGAYRQNVRITEDPRTIEVMVLARLTQALEASSTASGITPQCATALHENRMFWLAIIGDLASEGNSLPDSLKASLISLGLFVEKHSQHILVDGRPMPGMSALIDVNRSVMKGLAAKNAQMSESDAP